MLCLLVTTENRQHVQHVTNGLMDIEVLCLLAITENMQHVEYVRNDLMDTECYVY